MIDTKALRSRILDLAIQGKLTEQLPSDGTAEELYQQIQAEKLALIKEGKIKKEKPLPEISADEIPFEIPSNWKWVRWGNLSESIQYGYNAPAKESGRIKMVRITDIQNNKVQWDDVPYCDIDEESICNYILKDNDILFARTGGTVGKSFFVDNISEEAVYAGYLIRTRYSSNLCGKYLKLFMESEAYWKQLRQGTTATAQPNCNGQTLSKMIIPLPPLAEQKRIVERVEEIFRLLDTIDEAQEKYSADSQILKAKLITAGIQGKLTKQLESDGTAHELYQQIHEEKQKLIKEGKIKKEKPLPPISPDEIPFEIPQNWMWVRLSNIIDVRDGTHDSPKYHSEGIPLITSKNLSSGKLDFENVKLISYEDAKKINERSYVENGDILFAMIGTIGNPVIVDTDKEFCIKNVALFKRYKGSEFNMNYLYYFLLMEQYEMQKITLGGLQPFVSLKLFRSHLVPLPPLAEQKRIADVLERALGVVE